MAIHHDTTARRTPPRRASPYVTRKQLIATGLAPLSGLVRAARAGALVPVGRRGRNGPLLYRVADVEAWLATVGRSMPSLEQTAPDEGHQTRNDFSMRVGRVTIVGRGLGLIVAALAVLTLAIAIARV